MIPLQKPLVVFEMANNHMGHLEHGLRILSAFADVVSPFRAWFDFAFKLQYRHLDTFIHPQFQGRTDIKFVKRFQETRLSEDEFLRLREAMRDHGFLGVCTPFDERSVDLVEAHGFDFLKIASCSLGDWPLMERIALAGQPVIASTAGSDLETLDRVVSFFQHRKRPLALMHCVAEYPTPVQHLQLNQLDLLRERYPNLVVGFSTHEVPSDTRCVQMALAKGARLLEKHVGLATPDWPLNAYSAGPDDTRRWLQAAAEAVDSCGVTSLRNTPTCEETESLHSLRRGVFVKERVEDGMRIDPGQALLAMPAVPGQLTANDLSKYVEYVAVEPIGALEPVLWSQVRTVDHRARVYGIVQRVRQLLEDSRTAVSAQTSVEISHHYGLERFDEVGLTILNIVNRAYCKKLLVLLPGQRHPEQFHLKKEETFHLLHGEIRIRLDGEESTLAAGDVVTVERGVRHEFWSETGAVIEEISSTHFQDDSYYTDAAISQNPNRKTHLTYFFG